jgi:2-methylcitrate dehydratase PrpD
MTVHAGKPAAKAKSAGTITQALADFVVHCDLERLPPEVAARAKLFALDTLVVALAGAGAASSRIIVDVVEKLGGQPQANVIGWPLRSSVALAALANGAINHAVELDDDHRTSVLHPGTVVVPAALAMAEYCGASGKRFLEGVIAGYEIMTRIGDAFHGLQYYEGFHSTGTCGVFGAAAAAGRILGLDQKTLVTAFGIAGTQAAGLGEWAADGSWIKRLHPGKSAEAGVLAVLLARGGFTGPSTILEGEQGFLKAFSHERKWDEAIILEGLGESYRGHGTSFKPYACCRFSHQVVDATLAVIEKHRVRPQDVSDVMVRIHTTAYEKLFQPEVRRYRPQSVVDAQFSIPYIIATAILHGRPMPQHFTDEAIRGPEVLAMAARIKGKPDDEYEKQYPSRYPTLVTFRLYNGQEHSEYCDLPSGDPENPGYQADPDLFGREILSKVDALMTSMPRYAARRDAIVGLTERLDQVQDISELVRLLRP